MKIGIVVIYWNEWHLLSTQLLPNLEKIGWPKEDVIFLDSFFSQMSRWEKSRESDDGSIQEIQKAGYNVHHTEGNMLDVCNLRYKMAAEKGWDAVLWLDVDEYITGSVAKFKHTVEKLLEKYPTTTRLDVSFKDWNRIYDYNVTPQLILHPKNCRQAIMHTIYYNKETNERLVPKETVIDITINHDDTLRPDKRDRLNNAFSIVNGRYEKVVFNMAMKNKNPILQGMSVHKNDQKMP